jgi:hypothetical protein
MSFTCPCCGQDHDTEYSIAEAVARLADAHYKLQQHHREVDVALGKEERMRESAEAANVNAQAKVRAAQTEMAQAKYVAIELDEKLAEANKTIHAMKNAQRDEWLQAFSMDELLDEMARRRT